MVANWIVGNTKSLAAMIDEPLSSYTYQRKDAYGKPIGEPKVFDRPADFDPEKAKLNSSFGRVSYARIWRLRYREIESDLREFRAQSRRAFGSSRQMEGTDVITHRIHYVKADHFRDLLFDRDGVPFEGRHDSRKQRSRISILANAVVAAAVARDALRNGVIPDWFVNDCGGSGTRGVETIKLYTREQLDKLNATKAKRDAKTARGCRNYAAEQRATADAARSDFRGDARRALKRAELYVKRSDFIADVTR